MLEIDRQTGEMRERLVLRPELSAFDHALRGRVELAKKLQDDRFARPQALERDDEQRLTVVSEFVGGRRLSDAIDTAAGAGVVAGLDAGLGLLLELLPALACLHGVGGYAHGSLAPSRLIASPAGHIVVTDWIYGEVVERLGFARQRLWTEFGLALPPGAGAARLDIAGDLTQAAMIAASLTIGRPLNNRDYPSGIAALGSEIREVALIRGSKAFGAGVETFFKRLLPTASRRAFPSADEAILDLRQLVRREIGIDACRTGWVEFLQQVDAAEAEGTAAMPRVSADTARAEQQRREADHQAREALRRERERLDIERLEAERRARDEAERRAREEAERKAVEQRAREEAERKERERIEAERLALEEVKRKAAEQRAREEAERKERERLEAERLALEEAKRKAAEQRAREEAERKERERLEAERRAREEAERKAAEQRAREEAERKERERLEAERRAREEAERKAAEQRAREEAERKAAEQRAREEAERKERERLEAERRAREEAERKAAEQQAREEAERKEREEAERQEQEEVSAADGGKSSRRRKRGKSARARKDKLRSVAPPPSTTAASAPAQPASKSGWLVPPERAAAFAPPVPVTPPPMPIAPPPVPPPAARSYPVYVPPVDDGWAAPTPPGPMPPPSPPPVVIAPPRVEPPVLAPATEPIRVKSERAVSGEGTGRAPGASLTTIPLKNQPAVRSQAAPPPSIWDAPVIDEQEPARQIPWKLVAAAAVVIAVAAGAYQFWGGSGPAAKQATAVPASLPSTAPAPVAPTTGQIDIKTDPAGARVLLDGKPVGTTPLSIPEVPPGRHIVTLVGDGGSVRRTLKVEAGATATVEAQIFSGFVEIAAPIVLKVSEGGRALGNSENQIMLAPGRHELRLENKDLSFVTTQSVDIEPGEGRRLEIDAKGIANINAQPWAEVWIDGAKVGETPLANLPVTLGVREIVFRHPQFGERKIVTTVVSGTPTTVTMDFTKQQQ